MKLTAEEQALLDGNFGPAARKAMQILLALGKIYGAERSVPVSSVQIAGVSYDNLGEAGLQFLAEMAAGGGRTRVLTTLNPAGMDIENWQALGIDAQFASQQQAVIDAFQRMGVVTTCTCTPYLAGNLPHYGEHIAWAESSAVLFANGVLGARTNREGGPSALAAALTGRTPEYGYHLAHKRLPTAVVELRDSLVGSRDFGALGQAIGQRLQERAEKSITYIRGLTSASLEELKAFCASLATYGGAGMFHMEGITPEAGLPEVQSAVQAVERQLATGQILRLGRTELEMAAGEMSDAHPEEIDFVSLGCPHLSLQEIAHLADLLNSRQVKREFWITTSRPVKRMADAMGYSAVIQASGAKIAADTCCVVAPIRGRFNAMVTDSAKACYYAAAKHRFKTLYRTFEEVVEAATR